MDFTDIQAQLANLTSQLSQIAEKTRMQSVPTFGVSYGQGNQTPQLAVNEDAWGYQGYDQPSNHMCSNIYNSDWRGYSDYMWGEPQQVQQSGYWQQEDELYSRPMQPPQPPPQQFQSNSNMPMTFDEIHDVLTSLTQGSQQEEYLQPTEEFYQWSCAPHQSAQFNSGTSLDNDTFNKLLTSLNHEAEIRNKEMQNQTKKTDELEKHVGQIMEFMEQIQEQSELSNSPIANVKDDFEIHDAVTLESAMEEEAVPEPSKHSLEVDEELMIEEEEENIHTARVEQPLQQPPKPSQPPTTSKDVPNSIDSNVILPNAAFPCRFLTPQNEESEKDIVETIPKVQSDVPIFGATNKVSDCVALFEESCTPRGMIQEKEVDGESVKCIKEDTFQTTKLKDVEFKDTGQVTTITCNLAKFKIPETFKDVVFVFEFVSEQASKPSSPILILFSTNLLILMIQAHKLEFRPLPDHFKYHPPFKDKPMHSKKGDLGIAPQSDLRP